MNREQSLERIGEDLVGLIVDQAREVGQAVADDLDAVALYASQRADHLSLVLASGEPGFEDALVAERDNVVLRAAVASVERADDLDSRILTVASRAIRIAATALAAV